MRSVNTGVESFSASFTAHLQLRDRPERHDEPPIADAFWTGAHKLGNTGVFQGLSYATMGRGLARTIERPLLRAPGSLQLGFT
jgi:hypothetical protein